MTRLPELSAEKIYQAADRKRRARKQSWRAVAREIGLSSIAAFTNLGRGKVPGQYVLTPILLWADVTDLREFLKDPR